jgi:hypothetical protein
MLLAYLFWHRAAPAEDAADYENALVGFHHSLLHQRPEGLLSSVTLRAAEVPWLGAGGPGYEDWYVLDSWSALGVLEEAAVGRGHRTAHDRASRRMGEGTAAVYGLLEGCPDPAQAVSAAWVAPAPGPGPVPVEVLELLGDGLDPAVGGVWRRKIGLGPAPEVVVLGPADPPGVNEGRLPAGWTVSSAARTPLSGSSS